MVEKLLATYSSYIPFLTLGVAGKMHWNTNRIIEAVIIAALVSVMTGYITLAKLDISFEYMERHMSESIERIEDKMDKLEIKVDKLYEPRSVHK
jgi:hypothetical protein